MPVTADGALHRTAGPALYNCEYAIFEGKRKFHRFSRRPRVSNRRYIEENEVSRNCQKQTTKQAGDHTGILPGSLSKPTHTGNERPDHGDDDRHDPPVAYKGPRVSEKQTDGTR